MDIAIIGAGSFGTALAKHFSPNFNKINIYGRDKNIICEINSLRTNSKYIHSDLCLDSNIYGTTCLKEAIENTKYILITVSSQSVHNIIRELKPIISSNQTIINLAKGLDYETGNRLSEVIMNELPNNSVATLSGPSHAEEIIYNVPTLLVASSLDKQISIGIQNVFSTKTLRIYTNNDTVGVEIGGAAKNIIALASGILDGLGFGDNAKSALMIRGMQEIISIGTKLGGSINTFNGLTGMGDLIVTCTSKHSRNYNAGLIIASGASIEYTTKKVGMTVEGINACKSFHKLSKIHSIDMPITNALYKVLFNDYPVKDAILQLMKREQKEEFQY